VQQLIQLDAALPVGVGLKDAVPSFANANGTSFFYYDKKDC
jgi:hypothetical protein